MWSFSRSGTPFGVRGQITVASPAATLRRGHGHRIPPGASRRARSAVTVGHTHQQVIAMAKIRGSQKGLTMIEVLVSLMIFLVVLLAIYQLFDTSHATYASGTRKQDVQQQARLAMDEIVKRVRMAGYFPENFDGGTPCRPRQPDPGRHCERPGRVRRHGSGRRQQDLPVLLRRQLDPRQHGRASTPRCRDVHLQSGRSLGRQRHRSSRFQYFDATANAAVLAPTLDGQALGAVPDMTTPTRSGIPSGRSSSRSPRGRRSSTRIRRCTP